MVVARRSWLEVVLWETRKSRSKEKRAKRAKKAKKAKTRKRKRWYPNSRARPPRSGDCDKSWTRSLRKGGTEVDSQVAAPTESSTPNLHRAIIAPQRVRMEGWRQRRLGSNAKPLIERKKKNRLDTNRPSHGRAWPPSRQLSATSSVSGRRKNRRHPYI